MKRALGFVPLRWLSWRDGGMLSDNFGGIERNFFIACARVSRKLRRPGGLDEPDRNPICWMGVRSYRLCDNPSKVGQLEAYRNPREHSSTGSIFGHRSSRHCRTQRKAKAARPRYRSHQRGIQHLSDGGHSTPRIPLGVAASYRRRPPQHTRQLGEARRHPAAPHPSSAAWRLRRPGSSSK